MAAIAVIGAGLGGLVVARALSGSHDVTVFEKSRGVGGRMATRRAGPFEFDHGAQFFTARSEAFRGYLEPLIHAGVVADWPATFVEIRRGDITASRRWDEEYPHYVGVPGMSAVGKALASGLNIQLNTQVGLLTRQRARWRLSDDNGHALGEFDWVVIATPASQAAGLLAGTVLAHSADVAMQPCFALLLGFDEPVNLAWQAALVRDTDISWVSVNSSKPGRPVATCLVVHSTNAWADAHIDDDIETVRQHLVEVVGAETGIDAASAAHTSVHRWRYANIGRQRGDRFALDAQQKLAVCGDWFVRGRVEAAFSSADALVRRLALEL